MPHLVGLHKCSCIEFMYFACGKYNFHNYPAYVCRYMRYLRQSQIRDKIVVYRYVSWVNEVWYVRRVLKNIAKVFTTLWISGKSTRVLVKYRMGVPWWSHIKTSYLKTNICDITSTSPVYILSKLYRLYLGDRLRN